MKPNTRRNSAPAVPSLRSILSTSVIAICGAAFTATLMPGCTPAALPGPGSSEPGASPAAREGASTALRAGAFVFRFDPAKVNEIQIFHHERSKGAPFTARLERKGDQWRFVSVGRPLADRLADGKFIRHLIDTLTSVQIVQAPPEAPRGPLASFGLEQPRVALRWSDGKTTHELRLGNPLSNQGGAYALFPGLKTPDTQRKGTPPVYVVKSAALEMLGRVDTFESLRHRNLSTIDTDRIAGVEIRMKGLPVFEAKRGSGGWRSKKRVVRDFNAWVDRLTHLKVGRFVDDEARAGSLARKVAAQPAIEVSLAPGRGTAVKLQVALIDGTPYATVSSRPNVAFALDPATLRYFQPPEV